MRLAVVGVGRIGAAHAQVVRDHPEVDDVVLVDADPDRAAKVAEELGVAAGGSLENELPHVDGLVVTANTAAHPDLIIAGARAGVPVFCEKPVATDVTGTRAVLQEVQATAAVVQIGFHRRFDAGYQAARRALRSGRLGELRRAHVVTADQAPPDAAFIATSGGIFRDCHIHDFDILRWVTGREVAEVFTVGANRGAGYFDEVGDVDECVGLLTLDDGTLVTLQGSRYNGGGHDVRMELAGTRGTHVVGLSDRAPLVNDEPGEPFPSGEPWPNFWVRFTPAYVAEVQAFVELVQGKRENPCTVADALEAFYVAEAATLSRLERRPVFLDEVRSA